jgi:hypothetical protein
MGGSPERHTAADLKRFIADARSAGAYDPLRAKLYSVALRRLVDGVGDEGSTVASLSRAVEDPNAFSDVAQESSRRAYRSRVRRLLQDFEERFGSDLSLWQHAPRRGVSASPAPTSASHDTTISLPLPSGVYAELKIPAGLSALDTEALASQLEMIRKLLGTQEQALRNMAAEEPAGRSAQAGQQSPSARRGRRRQS